MNNLDTLARLSRESYATTVSNISIDGYRTVNYKSDLNFWGNGTGFTAHSYFSDTDNTLVISFAGTGDRLDALTDLQLATVGRSNQDNLALNFASQTINQLNSQGINDFNIVYTGH